MLAVALPMASWSGASLSVEVRQTGSATLIAACNWTPATETQSEAWTCTPDRDGKTRITSAYEPGMVYEPKDPGKECTITLSGPSGTKAVARTPAPPSHAESGEFPTSSCGCDYYDLEISRDDLVSVR